MASETSARDTARPAADPDAAPGRTKAPDTSDPPDPAPAGPAPGAAGAPDAPDAPDGPDAPAVVRGGYAGFLRIALRAGPALVGLALLAVLLAAAAPLAVTAAVGGAIGRVPGLAAHGLGSADGRAALGWIAAAGLFLVLQWASSSVLTATGTALGDRVDALLQRDLMDAATGPDTVAHLEDPAVADLLAVGRETFRGSWGRPGKLASTVGGLMTGHLTLIGSAVIVARFHLVVGAALLVVCLWAAHEDKVASRAEAAHHYGSTETARRLEYYYELGATPAAAKEIRVFGLGGFLVERFTATWRRTMEHVLTPMPVRPLLATAVLGAAVLGGLVWIAAEAAGGGIGAGAAAVYAQALLVGIAGSRQASWTGLQTELAFASLRRYASAVDAVQEAADRETAHREAAHRETAHRETAGGGPAAARAPLPRPHARPGENRPGENRSGEDRPGENPGEDRSDGAPPREAIRFEGVTFAYRDGDPVLTGLDLEIPAGRSLAVVGRNGAGKSTLVKLLCRLHEPTAGRVTVDGTDLAGLDTDAWRRRLTAVFQDTTRFPASARTTIAFGAPEAAADDAGVRAAAEAAGAADVLDGLAHGADTVLSAEFPGGQDLSGGQWQKMALARALFAVRHGAGVLLLDEPAAGLDARAEARLYERFLDLTAGLTTVVISHRFSTVRRADRIAVLDGGRVTEQGTHEELMVRDGSYAEMFRLQAARFGEDAPPDPDAPPGSDRPAGPADRPTPPRGAPA